MVEPYSSYSVIFRVRLVLKRMFSELLPVQKSSSESRGWRWLPHRLSKRQSTTTVLFRTTLTRTITLYELLYSCFPNLECCNNWWTKQALYLSITCLGEGHLAILSIFKTTDLKYVQNQRVEFRTTENNRYLGIRMGLKCSTSRFQVQYALTSWSHCLHR